MIYTSHIELNKQALQQNVDFIHGILKDKALFFSVVKGNAYGHGIRPYTTLASQCGIENFAVFSASEASEIMENNILPNRLMIMGFVDNADLKWAIENGIEFFVFDDDRLIKAIEIAKLINRKARIHIEFETGLNRTGYPDREHEQLFDRLLKNLDYVTVEGICSHLSGAESVSNYVRIKQQINKFNKITKKMKTREIPFNSRHLACSAATLSYPNTIMDIARVGILQYGYWPSRETRIAYFTKNQSIEDPLKRVISWKSKVFNIKEVSAGEYISYGTSTLAETKMIIAAIPIGYSNGFNRSLSNHGRVLIKGKRANVVGMVNMNLVLADVTHIPNVQNNDEVVLIGDQGNESISVSSFSDLTDTLNYELLTRLPSNIPRIIKH